MGSRLYDGGDGLNEPRPHVHTADCWVGLVLLKLLVSLLKVENKPGYIHRDTQTKYRNPHCACVLRVNKRTYSMTSFSCI